MEWKWERSVGMEWEWGWSGVEGRDGVAVEGGDGVGVGV